MNLNLPLSLGSISSLFRNPLALLGGVLLCFVPTAAHTQSVTFAGAQRVLPASVGFPYDVALDAAGDVFATDLNGHRVVELPKTATGYGPQTTLPAVGLSSPAGVTVDSAGDVFITDTTDSDVVELPWRGTGYGSQITLPFSGLYSPFGVVVDSAGDVFVADLGNKRVVELPKTPTGYGPQTTLPFSSLSGLRDIAVDRDKNVFIADFDGNFVLESPKTATGYGPQVTLPANGLNAPWGVALDSAGSVFISDFYNDRVVELPKTATGYGSQTTLPFSGLGFAYGVAVDNAGNVFVSDDGNNSVVELQTLSVDFGGANVCASGATTPAPCSQTLTLTYNVNADATLGKPEVLTGGMTHLDFTRASGSTCTGAVTAGTTCIVNVTFAPLAAGFRNGSVNITDGSGNFIATTQISGFGIAATTGPAVAQLSTAFMGFGTIAFGTSKNLPLMVTNIGGGTLTVPPSIIGHSYTINAAESTCAAGVTPGTSCTLVVEFSPTSIATHDDTLTLNTNGGDLTVGLAGTANGLSASDSLDFGSVAGGSTEVLPLTITNVGLPGTVTVGTAITGHAYTILTTAQNTCLAGIAAGQSCTLPVEFAPTLSGIHNDILTLAPFPGGGATTVWLNGSTP